MHVLLDTNIYLADITFNKPEFRALRHYLGQTNHKLLLPEIIELEIQKNVELIAKKEASKLLELASSKLNLIPSMPSIEDIRTAVTHNLNQNVFIKGTTRKIPSNQVSLELLISKSLEEKAPFKSQGRGFRDALIWHSLLNYLESRPNDTVAFISNNTLDFGDKVLKPELLKELVENGNAGRIIYSNSLGDFLTEYSEPMNFITNEFITDGVSNIAENHLTTIDEYDLEIEHSNLSNYDITKVDLDHFEVDNFYVYGSTKSSYMVYVQVVYLFNVDLSAMEYGFNGYTSNIDWHQQNEENVAWSLAEFQLKINKVSQEIEEVDYFG